MANRSKAIGTKEENRILERYIRPIWPHADRAKAGNKSNDIVGVPFPVEVKHRKVWDLRAWVRKLQDVASEFSHAEHQWVLFAGDGDRRRKESIGTVMVVDAEFGAELLEAWEWAGRQRAAEMFRVDL